MRRLRRMLTLASGLGALALGLFAMATAHAQQGQQQHAPAAVLRGDAVQRGRALYVEGCASCHALDLRGVAGRAPTLRGVGAAAVDFYVGTGRMPLARPGIEPQREKPQYTADQRRALIAYITSVDPRGPAIPRVRPEQGDLAHGQKLFADRCSGCHQIVGKGGIGTGFQAPSLEESTPTQVGEAIRVGPYLMPRWNQQGLSDADVDDVARYVQDVAQGPSDDGGWSIGNVGPIPEGLVAWLLAGTGLVLVARVIGERT